MWITDAKKLIPSVLVSAPVRRIKRFVKSIADNQVQRRLHHLKHGADKLTGARRYDRLQTPEPRLEKK